MTKSNCASGIDVPAAAVAIRSLILPTPLIRSEELSGLTGGQVYLKLENLQRTGSFKVRGAAFRLSSLNPTEKQRGVVTCSSGNHGRAVAFVARCLGIQATVCVPAWVDPAKLAAIQSEGAIVDSEAADYDEAERRAIQIGQERQLVFVHPFDDRHILAGQGTLALELLTARPTLDFILAPLSGGGLAGGIAVGVDRSSGSDCGVVAVSALRAGVMVASLQAGQPVDMAEEPTVASALSGGIGLENKFTFDIVRELIHEHAQVSETQIVDAMKFLARSHHVVVEGGGATAVAGVLAEPHRYRGKESAVVVSGGNIALKEWLRLVTTS